MIELLYWTFWLVCFAALVRVCYVMLSDSIFWAIVVFALVGGLGAALAYLTYDEVFVEHETFTLRTDRWTCTARHSEVQTIYISGANGSLTPLVTSHTVCDQYTRN